MKRFLRSVGAVGAAVMVAVVATGIWAGGASGAAPTTVFPAASGDERVSSTMYVKHFDGGLRRFDPSGMGNGNENEYQRAVFEVADGGTLSNVIIGYPGADGVHCAGTCTLTNVWWEHVGEDAATLMSKAPQGSVMTIDGGGARNAPDKVFQHNGPGTMIIKNFVVDGFGKLYRACGDCVSGYQGRRDVIVENVTLINGRTSVVGINANFGDTATLWGIEIIGGRGREVKICERYAATTDGSGATKLGSGPGDGCRYNKDDVVYR